MDHTENTGAGIHRESPGDRATSLGITDLPSDFAVIKRNHENSFENVSHIDKALPFQFIMAVCNVITPFTPPEWPPIPLRPLHARHLGASLAGT